MIDICVV